MDPARQPAAPPHVAAEEVPPYHEKDSHNVDIIADDRSVLEIESDPFVPFPDDPDMPQESHSQILTIRAILTGCILGGLVNASNVYLGLKAGYTVSMRPASTSPVFSINAVLPLLTTADLSGASQVFGEPLRHDLRLRVSQDL
jgi:hypothetical protein